MEIYEQNTAASGGRVDVFDPAGPRRIARAALISAEVDAGRMAWEPPTPPHTWAVAAHRGDIDWHGPLDLPDIVVGDIVRLVVDEHVVKQAGELGGPGNPITKGMLLAAVVVRVFEPGLVNLKVLMDGARDLWLTSVSYYPPLLQHPDPEDPTGERSLLHTRAGTWHPLDEPFGTLDNADEVFGLDPKYDSAPECSDCDRAMEPSHDHNGVFVEWWLCRACGRTVAND
jgi:hypothetical protein